MKKRESEKKGEYRDDSGSSMEEKESNPKRTKLSESSEKKENRNSEASILYVSNFIETNYYSSFISLSSKFYVYVFISFWRLFPFLIFFFLTDSNYELQYIEIGLNTFEYEQNVYILLLVMVLLIDNRVGC